MNFDCVRGDDQTFLIEIKENGIAVDISAWTFWLTVKKDIETADNATGNIQKKVSPGGHSDPTNGKTEIKLLNTETLNLDGVYDYDLQYKDNSTPVIIKTVLLGKMIFRKDVTRSVS